MCSDVAQPGPDPMMSCLKGSYLPFTLASGFSSESNVSIPDCIQRSLLCRSGYMCFFLHTPLPRKVPGNRTFSQEPHPATTLLQFCLPRVAALGDPESQREVRNVLVI